MAIIVIVEFSKAAKVEELSNVGINHAKMKQFIIVLYVNLTCANRAMLTMEILISTH
jgi:hypothetical protein